MSYLASSRRESSSRADQSLAYQVAFPNSLAGAPNPGSASLHQLGSVAVSNWVSLKAAAVQLSQELLTLTDH